MKFYTLDRSVTLEYSKIPIAFRVESMLEVSVVNKGLGGIALEEKQVDEPYIKDLATIPACSPMEWHLSEDTSEWKYIVAIDEGLPVGGIVVTDVREGTVVHHDYRVVPSYRRTGIGRELMKRALDWSDSQGCSTILGQNQNTNVPGCRFMINQGYNLVGISIHGLRYIPELKGETQLLWMMDRSRPGGN